MTLSILDLQMIFYQILIISGLFHTMIHQC